MHQSFAQIRKRESRDCSPLLHDLRWLPVRLRRVFKILLVTCRAIHGMAPLYIRELGTLKSLSESRYRL